MRTLVQSITEYMKQGVRPVKFLRITDADTGTELLMQGTAEHGDYEDRIASFGSVTQEIAPEGGIASVSGVTIEGLYCDKRIPLCTEAALAPKYEGVTCGAGRAICTNTAYASARNSGPGAIASAAIVAGRNYTGSEYSVMRGYMQFEVPDDLATCEDAYLELAGVGVYSPDTALTLVLVEGTWASLYLTGGTVYSSFDGWVGSGAYAGTALNEAWTTAEYGPTNYIRLNEAGRDYIASCAGGVAKFALLTTRDTLNASAPTGQEFVVFQADAVRLNIRYNSITLDNQVAAIYYALRDSDGNLPDDYTGMDLVWKGVVDSYTLNDRILSLTLRQNNFVKDKLIPAEVITTDDWPDCPEGNVGKAIPVVYGKASPSSPMHKDGIGYEIGETYGDETGIHNYFPCPVVVVGEKYNTPCKAAVSEKAINGHLSFPATWISSGEVFARFVASEIDRTSGGKIYLDLSAISLQKYEYTGGVVIPSTDEKIDFWGIARSIIPSGVITAPGFVNPERAFSKDISEYASVPGDTGIAYMDVGLDKPDSLGTVIYAEVMLDVSDLTIEDAGVKVLIFPDNGSEITSGSAGAVEFDYHNEGSSDYYWKFLDTSGDFSGITDGDNSGDWLIISTDGQFVGRHRVYDVMQTSGPAWIKFKTGGGYVLTGQSNLEYRIVRNATATHSIGTLTTWGGQLRFPLYGFDFSDSTNHRLQIVVYGDTEEIRISHVQLRVYTELDTPDTIYLNKQGYLYDSWVTGRLGISTYSIVENPAHIIEAFGRNEMGLATAEIDTSAVDAAYTACGDAVLGFQLNEQEKASEILNDIAYQSRLMVFYDHQNRLSCKKVNSSDTFPVSDADYPALLDTFNATGTPSSGSFTVHPLMGEVEISQMELDETYDDFIINYRKNYATNKYMSTITCNKDGFSADYSYLGSTVEAELVALCSTCYDRIKTTNTLTVDCDKIMDDNTAHLLVEHLVRWFVKRRDKVEFSAAHTAMLFTLGDLINVQSARLDDRYGVATARVKKWLVIKIVHDLDNDTFTFTAIEV